MRRRVTGEHALARIVVITHTSGGIAQHNYLLNALADCWLRASHSVVHAAGFGDWPEGDVAVMHVDLSVMPPAYREAAAREPAPVPARLRVERQRLGFDYGKFDFVARDGEAILLDANRTPGGPPANPDIGVANAHLACGLEKWLR